jgi:hypothetical protein
MSSAIVTDDLKNSKHVEHSSHPVNYFNNEIGEEEQSLAGASAIKQ